MRHRMSFRAIARNLCLILAAAWPAGLTAQGTDTSNAARAKAVVMRHMEAIGGMEAYSAVQSVHTTLSMRLPFGIDQRAETWTTKPNLAYGKVWNQHASAEFGFDGRIYWSIDTEEGPRILSRPPDVMGSAAYDPYAALVRYEPVYLGTRERGGQKMDALQWLGEDGQRYTQYYDRETGLFARLEVGEPTSPVSVMRFERYKRFGPLLYATVMSVKLADATEVTSRTVSVDHEPIDPKRYELPKEIKALVARSK